MAAVTIGKVWAICDHFESHTGNPVSATTLKQATGLDRKQLRDWERQGRLDVFYITTQKGTRVKGYMRPKNRKEGESVG